MQLSPCIFACKSPLDLGTSSIAFFFQLLDLSFQPFFISNAPVKALTTEDAQLDFRNIQPTPMLGRVVKLQLPQDSPRLFWRERLIQRCRRVGVQVVEHHPHPLCLRVCFIYKPLHLSREVLHRSLLTHLDVSPPSLRLTHHKQVAHSSSLIFVIEALDFSGTGRDRMPSLSNQLFARLIKADRGTLLIIIFSVQIENIFHAGDKLGVYFAYAPLLFQPRLEFVFLSTWRTVSRAIDEAKFNSTTLSANSRSVQRACPVGGVLQAMAIIWASCLPVSLRACPRRGRSLRQPNPSSTKRLRVRSTVAKAVLSEATICSSVEPSEANSRMRARVTLREECLPRLTSWSKVSRSSADKSTRYFFLGIGGQPPFSGLNQTIPFQRADPQN